MVFSNEDKIIIQNDYEEKSWSACEIWNNHPSENGVIPLKFRETGSMYRRYGLGQPMTVST